MARECDICGKRKAVGWNKTYRGMAKYKGGVGRKVTGRTKRDFRPNLQRVRALVKGTKCRMRVCTRCLKAGFVKKPARRVWQSPAPQAVAS